MSITIEQTFYEPIPTGRYAAKIASIEKTDGQFGAQLKFTFELPPGEDGETRNVSGWTSWKFSKKSKLYLWIKAAFGGEVIDRSYAFCSDDLIGRKVYLNVVEEEGDQGPYNKITSLSPYIELTSQPALSQPLQDEGNW